MVADPKGGPYRKPNFDGARYCLVMFQPKGALFALCSEGMSEKGTVHSLSVAGAILDDGNPEEIPKAYILLSDNDPAITPQT